ncbi:ribbon-helix-helix domain-containing protein [Natroniella sulfidigena]|uniref:ribbon-helix-helix domain-containing protein n=1 Tax=Natroniella sulfidigena TaxID=723921 RepID=UPI00200AFA83|nr:ribbon-helix-helix domain-containing protein [Natroniella sulfidigena]MCK8816282.1 ribbon-helix-helix domain-containing protein [Natroniella sulfidigena]
MSDLTTRKRITTTLDKDLIDKLDNLSKETRIPKSKLFDEAIKDLLEKHKK